MNILNRAACLSAAMMCLLAAGCSNSDKGAEKSSSKTDVQTTAATSSAADEADTPSEQETQSNADSTEQSEPSAEDYQPGEKLAKTAELFTQPYTYSVKISYSDTPDVIMEAVIADDGENYYCKSAETGAEGINSDIFMLTKDGTSYLADNNLGAYSEVSADSAGIYNIINEIIDNKLEQTNTRIPDDTQGYTVEEYTYAGSTYITIYDFYFDENDALVKYTAAYTVEGDDDLVETVEVISLTEGADESYFDDAFLDELTDFGGMTEDERLGFCQGICGTYGISTDNMYELDITTDDLKRIGFADLQTLFYTFGKP